MQGEREIDLEVPARQPSASERWRDHFMGSDLISGCPICKVGETEFDADVLCDIGRKLRDESIADAYVAPPEEMLREAREAISKASMALNRGVTYYFNQYYLAAQREIDQARQWMAFAAGRVRSAELEITGGES